MKEERKKERKNRNCCGSLCNARNKDLEGGQAREEPSQANCSSPVSICTVAVTEAARHPYIHTPLHTPALIGHVQWGKEGFITECSISTGSSDHL
jgi:hypothetical protein